MAPILNSISAHRNNNMALETMVWCHCDNGFSVFFCLTLNFAYSHFWVVFRFYVDFLGTGITLTLRQHFNCERKLPRFQENLIESHVSNPILIYSPIFTYRLILTYSPILTYGPILTYNPIPTYKSIFIVKYAQIHQI